MRWARWGLLLAAFPAGAGGQESAPVVGCLHGVPAPVCATFWIVELQASEGVRLRDVPENAFSNDLTQYEWNLGHMRNLGTRWALGGTVSVGSGSDGIFTGARARMRRWLGSEVSVELEAGVAESNGDGAWRSVLRAPSVGLRFNIQDRGSVFVRYDGFGEPGDSLFAGPNRPRVAWGPQEVVRAGVGLGGTPALVGTGVVAAVFALYLVAYLTVGGGS